MKSPLVSTLWEYLHILKQGELSLADTQAVSESSVRVSHGHCQAANIYLYKYGTYWEVFNFFYVISSKHTFYPLRLPQWLLLESEEVVYQE